MTPRREISDDLAAQIARLREMLLKVHYFDEAQWLGLALDRQACTSDAARDGLVNARSVARQLGFPRVAEWIGSEVLDGPHARPPE